MLRKPRVCLSQAERYSIMKWMEENKPSIEEHKLTITQVFKIIEDKFKIPNLNKSHIRTIGKVFKIDWPNIKSAQERKKNEITLAHCTLLLAKLVKNVYDELGLENDIAFNEIKTSLKSGFKRTDIENMQ